MFDSSDVQELCGPGHKVCITYENSFYYKNVGEMFYDILSVMAIIVDMTIEREGIARTVQWRKPDGKR